MKYFDGLGNDVTSEILDKLSCLKCNMDKLKCKVVKLEEKNKKLRKELKDCKKCCNVEDGCEPECCEHAKAESTVSKVCCGK